MLNWQKRFVLGITGIIGSGKSTAAKIFEELGAYRINADELAKFYSSEKSPIIPQLVELLSDKILDNNGVPDRKVIANIVFNNKSLLERLNQLLHPLVRKDALNIIEKIDSGQVIVWEVPLLFESNANKNCNATLTVVSSEEIACQRAMVRSRMTRDEFFQRLGNQMNLKKKMELSDFIINNDRDYAALLEECKLIYKQILEFRG